MNLLVHLEHDGSSIRAGSLSTLTFAQHVATLTQGSVRGLLIGSDLTAIAEHAAQFAPILVADAPDLNHPLADNWADVMAQVVRDHDIDLLVAAANTLSKDIVARAAGLLGGAMASDVIAHSFADGTLTFKRPMFAGSVVASVQLSGHPQVVTVRATSYPPAEPRDAVQEVEPIDLESIDLPNQISFLSCDFKDAQRPDVTEARIVVSGGRAIKNAEDFERIVGGLADALHGATGSSRALVDAGVTPNEFQVGQTGKIVAPDLYVALGISGAVQHLAGMKNSKVVAAINSDRDAPIFEVADYGLVADIYDVVPEWIEQGNDD